MRLKLLYILQLVLLFAFFCPSLSGQFNETGRNKYSLLTKPYNERSLQLYRGQLQFNTGFELGVRTRIFDHNGTNIRDKSDGVTSVNYLFPFEIRYGITDFVEIEASTSYSRTGIPDKTISYILPGYMLDIYSLNELRGMADLLVSVSLRLPFEYKHADFSLGGGVFLPTAKHRPEQPHHTLINQELEMTDGTYKTIQYTVKYWHIQPNGLGVPVYRLTASGKIGYQKLSLHVNSAFRFPAKIGKNIRWSQSMDDTGNFSYESEKYDYLPDRTVDITAIAHYQINGWFDIHLSGSTFWSSKGWTEYSNKKFANREQQLYIIEPGFAIQVSPSLTLYQSITFPLSGKNIDGRFGVSIKASFNVFPFFKEN